MGLLLLQSLHATLVPRFSFEQLTDASEVIVEGKITDAWTEWDPAHKYIWTHYRISVASALKGSTSASVEFAEPGGTLGDHSTLISGAIRYTVGENAVIFLSRMPNGYLRTAGWAQGKFQLDANNKLHASTAGPEIIEMNSSAQGTSLKGIEGIGIQELRQRVSARIRATQGRIQ
jgi:hypothetical protein